MTRLSVFRTQLPRISAALSRKALPVLFPRKCPICRKLLPYGARIHPPCRKQLPYVTGPTCFSCGKPIASAEKELCYDCRVFPKSFRGGCALFLYESHTRPLMSAFKYQNRRILADFFTEEIASELCERLALWAIDAVVPVPIHKNKRKKRGYNQAELLSARIALLLGLPHLSQLLIRVVDTLPQKQFSPQARLSNLTKAFQVSPHFLKKKSMPSTVLLVDDIYTTGATMEACTRVLKEAGVQDVYILSVCIGVSRD